MRSAERMSDTYEQVSPELIAFVSDRDGSDALFVTTGSRRGSHSALRRLAQLSPSR
jgi:hypothetical protein